MKVRQIFITVSIVITLIIIGISFFWKPILWSFVVVIPLILMGIVDIVRRKHAVRRNFPVIGRARYLLESIRPGIMQYFVETDTEGRPLDRVTRSMIYQRAKNVTDTVPFGAQMNTNDACYVG